uniref:Uncharacterized protein n=1 Tax=Faxonius propinquus nudivirus TaxID=3139431 RepID=A0AAU8GBG9_9VIRU
MNVEKDNTISSVIFPADNNSSIIINNKKYSIDPQTKEFIYKNERYTIFQNIFTMRKHKTLTEFVTEQYKIPSIIKCDNAMIMIKRILSISKYNLSLIDATTNESIKTESLLDTVEQIKNDIEFMLKKESSKVQLDESEYSMKDMLLLITSLCDNIEFTDIEKGIIASKPIKIELSFDMSEPCYKLLEILIKYMIDYINYAENIIQFRSLNTAIDSIYSVLYMIILDISHIPSDIYTSENDLILQRFLEMIFDGITDRCSYELFIKERNSNATLMKNKYFKSYPILRSITNKHQAQRLDLTSIFKATQIESISLIPYIATFNMDNSHKIQYLYEYLYSKRKLISQCNADAKWFTINEIMDCLKELTESCYKVANRYNPSCLSNIAPRLFALLNNTNTNTQNQNNKSTTSMDDDSMEGLENEEKMDFT